MEGFVEVVKHSDICKKLGSLLERSEKHAVPGKQRRFELQVTLVLNDCINKLIEEVKIYSNGGWGKIKDDWDELRRVGEISERRLRREELRNPSTEQDFKAALWWMVERGVEADLVLIRELANAPAFTADEIVRLLQIAKERISERVYGRDKELPAFFDLSYQEFARIIGRMHALEDLRSIKESLEALFKPEEIRRWLHTPKSMFAGRTPVEMISRGESDRILEILVRLEQGIHN